MQINQYSNEAFVINDEDFYDVDLWNGSGYQSHKISGATLKSILGANIYNADGQLDSDRFVDLNDYFLSIYDVDGDVRFVGGNKIQITSGSGVSPLLILNSKNGSEPKSIQFQSNSLNRWDIATEVTEIGGDIGSDLVIKSFDDAGFSLAELIRCERQGLIKLFGSYYLPSTDGAAGQIITTDGIGNLFWTELQQTPNYNSASTQYKKTLTNPIQVVSGDISNLCSYFDSPGDQISEGTTSYFPYNLQYSRTITLSGTTGTANINVNGVNHLATFSSDVYLTASNWALSNQVTMNALGIRVYALGANADGRIRFCASDPAILDLITITNVSGTLGGTLSNEFVGSSAAALDHFLFPYNGSQVDTQHLIHSIQVNLELITGSTHFVELTVFSIKNDDEILPSAQMIRNPHTTAQHVLLQTYQNANANHFGEHGFWIGLNNVTNTDIDIEQDCEIFISTMFQKPTYF